jgi:hypothetical protein
MDRAEPRAEDQAGERDEQHAGPFYLGRAGEDPGEAADGADSLLKVLAENLAESRLWRRPD